jgi:chemotaxis protein MotB
MARRRKTEQHTNHERWLVSYADFITLLFAFFVVMFASAEADRGKAARVSEAVRKALDDGQVASVLSGILGGTKGDKGKGNALMMGPGGAQRVPNETPPPASTSLASSLDSLRSALKIEIEKGELQITLEHRGLVVSLREASFFASGDDAVYPGSYPTVGKIAEAIERLPNSVRLEGHTDSVPIHNARFGNNWELSAARAIATLELLTSRFGVPPERMAIGGYADTVPLESNSTPEGRAHNRRVDIVILSGNGIEPEPQAGPKQ